MITYTEFYQSLLENHNVHELLGSSQNQALKIIYTHCRDALKEIYEQAKAVGLDQDNYLEYFPRFYNTVQLKHSIKTPSAYEVRVDITPFIVKVNLPNEVLKEFPKIARGKPYLYILLCAPDDLPKSSTAAVLLEDGVPMEVAINMEALLANKNWNAFASILQHELQHIADIHDPEMEKIAKEKLPSNIHSFEGTLQYFLDPMEVQAYAKQIAYLYNKFYPDAKTIDGDKIKQLVPNESSIALAAGFYFKICRDPILAKKEHIIPDNYKLTQQNVDKMRATYRNFVRELTRSLNYFVKVPAKFTLQ